MNVKCILICCLFPLATAAWADENKIDWAEDNPIKHLDTNSDGIISKQEAYDSNDDALLTNWDKMDSNKDGEINSAEFSAFEVSGILDTSNVE